jgi:hypothetical protein
MTELNTIAFHVVPSPETNDHEVEIFVDGRNFIAQHWPEMMGMDPDDLLSYQELSPRNEPHEATVVRCGCGIVGCGSAWVRICADEDRVVWDHWQGDTGKPPAATLVFDRNQYMQAVRDAVEDHTWETPDRTAARILSSLVDHRSLALHNLNYQWASGRVQDSTFTISLALEPGHDQILVHVHWSGQTPGEIAHEAADLLKTDPNGWPNVVWYGQKTKPPVAGAGWRNFR